MKRKKHTYTLDKEGRKNTGWKRDKHGILVIFADNKRFLMPVMFFIAVLITFVIAFKANRLAAESAMAGNDNSVEVNDAQDAQMAECTDPAVNDLINKYYTATAEGDEDVIRSIYRGLVDSEVIKAQQTSGYIEGYESIKVYTKQGPIAGSYIAYVYNMVKLYNYEKAIPGLETLYICTDEATGELYINGETEEAQILEYIKKCSMQADVIDLNNKIASQFNEMINSDEKLAAELTSMRKELQEAVGRELAARASEDASTATSSDAATEETSETETETKTVYTIRATGDSIRIRQTDSTEGEILEEVNAGAEFKEIEAQPNGWSKIEYNGGEAYVKTDLFERVGSEEVAVPKDETAEEETDVADAAANAAAKLVEANNANKDNEKTDNKDAGTDKNNSSKTGKMTVKDTVRLRKGQGTDSAILTNIFAGSTVNVLEQYSNGWAKVEYDGQTGYIKSEFIDQ